MTSAGLLPAVKAERTDERAERKLFPQINAGRPALFLIACERTGIANGSNLRRWAAPSLPPHPSAPPPPTPALMLSQRVGAPRRQIARLSTRAPVSGTAWYPSSVPRDTLYSFFSNFSPPVSQTQKCGSDLFCFNWEERKRQNTPACFLFFSLYLSLNLIFSCIILKI